MNYYCEHNICPMQTSLPLATDTVMVNNALHLQQVSDLLQVDIETLRALNPQYKRDIVPGNTRPSVLKLPAQKPMLSLVKKIRSIRIGSRNCWRIAFLRITLMALYQVVRPGKKSPTWY